jgi:hypothetical protein
MSNRPIVADARIWQKEPGCGQNASLSDPFAALQRGESDREDGLLIDPAILPFCHQFQDLRLIERAHRDDHPSPAPR